MGESRFTQRAFKTVAKRCRASIHSPRAKPKWFALLAKGRNAEYIAGQLMVTPATIKSHIYHIYQKLGVNSQQRLMDLVDEGKR